MPAISLSVCEAMSTNLNKYFNKYKLLNQLHLTHDEYLDLIAKREHHDILRNAAKYAHISNSSRWGTVKIPFEVNGIADPEVGLYVSDYGGKEPPLTPREINWHADAPAAHKVVAWMSERIDVGKKVAITNYALQQLSHWDSAAKVRFVWPAVMQLCRPLTIHESNNQEKLENWAKRNSAYKAQSSVPALSPALRDALRVSSQWLTACSLLPENIPEERGEVDVDFSGTHAFAFHGQSLYVR